MLKQGLYIDSAGEEHSIHVVEEPQFYRIDITHVGSNFHTDVDDIEFSLVRKRRTFQYGDRRVYDEYLSFLDKIHNIKADSEKISEWKDGKYVTRIVRQRSDINFMQETQLVNGVYSSDTIILGNQSITMFVTSDVYGVKLEPINFVEYEEVMIAKDVKENLTTPYLPLKVLKSKYDISHIDKKDCMVVTDVETAKSRLYEWMRAPTPVKGFDTETTGTDVDMYGEDKLVGIILAYDKNGSTYFPFRHEEFNNLPMEFLDELMRVVKLEESKLVAHNKKFDRKVMLKEGYDLLIHWDTMLLSFILNPVVREKGAHALKELMLKVNGLKFLELDEIFVSEKLIDFSKLPIDIVKYYACPDAYNVIELFEYLYAKLPVYQRKLFELECKLADLKADQEYYGMRVDVKKFADGYENCNYVIDMLIKAFRELTHVDGNINSPAVLSDLLYNKMKCKVLLRTKTGKASTSSAAIRKLASIKNEVPKIISKDLVDLHGNVVIKAKDLAVSKYPALVILDKYREYNKRKTAFYSRFERTMKTGRIFFWINQNGAESGRQSSPMHQLPPELKAVMLSDDDSRDLWGPDYSQIELRMVAYLSGETDLIELCKDPENDIHRVIGSLISGLEMWEITNKMRSEGKRRNFGVVYLISEYGLAGQVFGPGYTEEQVAWCKEQLDAFYKRFKRITRYIRENKLFVQEKGYMMTKGYNRIRFFKEILDPDISSKRKASLLRQANNMPVQGTSADLMKLAEVNMYYYTRQKGWYDKENGLPLVRPMLSIHDEVLISAHKSIHKEEIIEMITKCMQIDIEGAPPFFVSPALMDNWEGHSDDSLAIPVLYRDKLISDYRETGISAFKQSYYRLVLTEELKQELIDKRKIPKHTLLDEYQDKVQWEYIKGDYGTTITDEGKRRGLSLYLESGKTVYEDSNYRKLLADYRDSRLRDYMDELIAQYGTNPDIVGKHVRHPSLTHELLARFKKELKEVEHLDLSHEEQITYATKCYIEGISSSRHDEEIVQIVSDNEELFKELETLVNFDEYGNAIFEEEEAVEDEYSASVYDDERFINYITSGESYKVWEVADAITIDVESLEMKEVNKVIQEVWKQKDDNGFFKVYLMYGGKLIDTKFRVEELDYVEITNLIKRLEKNTA